MFLISGMIPRVTPYEIGVVRGIRFHSSSNSWEKDEMIADERLLMCNLKGVCNVGSAAILTRLTHFERQRDRDVHRL
jgi:hypothetical protein